MIKFQCEHCGQKLGVPEKHAGRAVRCTRCREAARVPNLEPQPLAESEIERYETESPFPEENLLGGDVDALAALGAPSGELRELRSAPQAAASKGGACPNCGAAVGPQAVICIQCGNNLKSGGKVKTKVGKDKSGGGGGGVGITGRSVVAVIVGCIVAGFLGFLWFIIAAIFSREMGILAWGIGGLAGLTVAAISGQRSVGIGIAATSVAAFGLFVGKGLMFLTVVGLTMLPGAVDSLGDAMSEAIVKDPELFAMTYVGYMEEERLFDTELQAKIDAVPEDAFYDDALYDQMQAAAEAKVAGMTLEDRQAFMESYSALDEDASAELDDSMQELSNLNAWSETFSLWDLLWFPLALGTAFSVGKGKD